MGMRTGAPQTALEAAGWRRLPFTSWPWRSLGYLLVTLPARYTDPAAWRETSYAILLASLVPVLCAAALLAVLLAGVLIASPFMVAAGLGPISLLVGQVSTVRQAVPYVIVGIALLPLLP